VSQRPYYRDIWALPNPITGYPGAFPRGLVNKIKRKWWGKKRLWMFSGGHKDPSGTTIDIKPEVEPSIIADCSNLEMIPDGEYDFVMLDPPYSEAEAKELYNLPYVSVLDALSEAFRVCADGGHVLLLHRLIPETHPKIQAHGQRMKIVGIVGVYTFGGVSNIRALTIWRKNNGLPTLDASAFGCSECESDLPKVEGREGNQREPEVGGKLISDGCATVGAYEKEGN